VCQGDVHLDTRPNRPLSQPLEVEGGVEAFIDGIGDG
jgi:hypothetical protein